MMPGADCENVTGLLPAPSAVPAMFGTRVPNTSSQVTGFVVEIRNHAVVAAPLGFAEPLSVAVVVVTPLCSDVVTVGVFAGAVKLVIAPNAVPTVLLAIAQ